MQKFLGWPEESKALSKFFTKKNEGSPFYVGALLNQSNPTLKTIGKMLVLKFAEVARDASLNNVKTEGGSNTIMTIACPCGCSNAKGNGPSRYALYVSPAGKLQANSFSKACNCLGYQGLISCDGASLAYLLKNPYTTPTFGAIQEYIENVLSGIKIDPVQLNVDYNNYLDDVEKNSETAIKNVQRFLDGAQWGNNIGKNGQKLLADRGIDLNLLSEETKSQIGYVGYNAPVKTLYMTEEKDGPKEKEAKCTRRGIVFKLSSFNIDEKTGELTEDYGISLRVAVWDKELRTERFVTKKEEEETKNEEQRYKQLRRFYIAGKAKVFNSQVLYREDNAPIFVSEGAIDAVSLEMALYDSQRPAGKAVSLQGAGTQKYFLDAIENFKGVVFLTLDEDKAGQKNQDGLENSLKEKGIQTLRFPNFLGKKDANELWQSNPVAMRKFVRTVQFIGQCVADGKLSAQRAQERLNNMKHTTIEQWTSMDVYKIKDSIEKDFISAETQKLPEKPIESEPKEEIYQKIEEPSKTENLSDERSNASDIWDTFGV